VVKLAVGLLIAATALAGARAARTSLSSARSGVIADPYVPSRQAAPYVALGYREAAADVLYVRLVGYFADFNSSADAVAGMAEAIATLDPSFHRIYDMGANAMTLARYGVDQSIYRRAIALLEKGMKEFPTDWKLPYLAGQIYTQDLRSDNPADKRAWDERGTLLIESALRKPGAPQEAANWAAVMRTKLGQHERAVSGLRELILITHDEAQRRRMLEALAQLEEDDSGSVAAEVLEERLKFERTWRAERRTIPQTMFVLLGGRIVPGFDMNALATGGRELLDTSPKEPLEPLE
jgi:hypothetical protein